jgi:propionyl-CoA carboxylase alpha chain
VAAERGYIDDVIMPHETRKRIVPRARTLKNKQAREPLEEARQHSAVTMFKKILIANRGEIACRVIKTARRMGIKTVASSIPTPTRDACMSRWPTRPFHRPAAGRAILSRHRQDHRRLQADRARGGASGLRLPLRARGFADRAEAERHRLHRPQPHAIEAMGDKIESKKAPRKRPRFRPCRASRVIADAKHAVKIADEIGYPVMIKASAGGGGKGMRIAYSQAEVEEGFPRAKPKPIVLRRRPRLHREVHRQSAPHRNPGAGRQARQRVYLGERECSIQRRNQKVIEEAPSPLLDEKTRKARWASRPCRAGQGRELRFSAGTVEFVAGQDKSFYFLEMNTRLQVEHPVTELITGIDLVEQMIRVAAGEPLPVQAEGREAQRLGGREPHLCRRSVSQLPAVHRPARAIPAGRRQDRRRRHRAQRHRRLRGRRDLDVLRSDDRQARHPRAERASPPSTRRRKALDAFSSTASATTFRSCRADAASALARRRQGALSTGFIAESKALLCPMPGLVKAVYVTVGQEVKAGEPLCMVEAMKMENVLRAERDATVKKINAKEGDSLAVDAVIMEFN